jgi:hypothetical protein
MPKPMLLLLIARRHGHVNSSEQRVARGQGVLALLASSHEVNSSRNDQGRVRYERPEPLGSSAEKWTLPYTTCPRVSVC